MRTTTKETHTFKARVGNPGKASLSRLLWKNATDIIHPLPSFSVTCWHRQATDTSQSFHSIQIKCFVETFYLFLSDNFIHAGYRDVKRISTTITKKCFRNILPTLTFMWHSSICIHLIYHLCTTALPCAEFHCQFQKVVVKGGWCPWVESEVVLDWSVTETEENTDCYWGNQAGFMTYTAVSHQVVIKTLWPHFRGGVMSSIFVCSVRSLSLTSVTELLFTNFPGVKFNVTLCQSENTWSDSHSWTSLPRCIRLELPAVETCAVIITSCLSQISEAGWFPLGSLLEKVLFSADTVELCEHINEFSVSFDTLTLLFILLWEKTLSSSSENAQLFNFYGNFSEIKKMDSVAVWLCVVPCYWCVREPDEGVSRTSPWWWCWNSRVYLKLGPSTAPRGPWSEEAVDPGQGRAARAAAAVCPAARLQCKEESPARTVVTGTTLLGPCRQT